MGIAPSGRASYTAPSDVMADLPPNEQVNQNEGLERCACTCTCTFYLCILFVQVLCTDLGPDDVSLMYMYSMV